MQGVTTGHAGGQEHLWRLAAALALISIFYNVAEGFLSVLLGLEDETVALFGFGLDSFVEVISGAGVWHMIRRIRRGGDSRRDRFERRALWITGVSTSFRPGYWPLSSSTCTGDTRRRPRSGA
jgi:hypothetical protein